MSPNTHTPSVAGGSFQTACMWRLLATSGSHTLSSTQAVASKLHSCKVMHGQVLAAEKDKMMQDMTVSPNANTQCGVLLDEALGYVAATTLFGGAGAASGAASVISI